MTKFFKKANRILLFMFIGVVITVILLAAIGGFYYKYMCAEKDTITYSSWKSDDKELSIDILEKNRFLGENVYTGVIQIGNMDFHINIDTDKSTIVFYKSGNTEPSCIGLCDFNENSFEIEFLKNDIQEIDDKLIFYRFV